ncbi:MAG: response regulator transcription factor [Desulfobacterales bacterium]|nr:response regulator transcription factor [Desulfobacterales bacterium]
MSSKAPKVGIVSKNLFQSQLLARFLELESGVFCIVCSPFDESGQAELSKNHLSLILWDCDGSDPDHFWDELNRFIHSRAQNRPVALLNAPNDPDIEIDAIEKGLCGVFSRHTEPGLFAKGVSAILNGESWYSRQCLARYLAASRKSGSNPPPEISGLSQREKQILGKIASGYTRARISADLSISPHTVKTHIRNIYKKLGVNTRFEAIREALKYI